MAAVIEKILKRDRQVVAVALLLVAGLAWAWLLAGAGMDMDAFEMTRHSMMDMPMPDSAPWSAAYAVLMFFMWWIMMIAMMLPAATPVILLAAAVNRGQAPDSQPYGTTLSFVTGYLMAWALFSVFAVILQWLLQSSGLLNSVMVSSSELLAGLVLLLAGAWQFSPWKQACLRQCRNPVEILASRRRPGSRGSIIMGAQHGIYCVGCCWFLMALLFVGGVMNLYWIIGLTIYVLVEKMSRTGPGLSRLLGILLVGWGSYVLAGV